MTSLTLVALYIIYMLITHKFLSAAWTSLLTPRLPNPVTYWPSPLGCSNTMPQTELLTLFPTPAPSVAFPILADGNAIIPVTKAKNLGSHLWLFFSPHSLHLIHQQILLVLPSKYIRIWPLSATDITLVTATNTYASVIPVASKLPPVSPFSPWDSILNRAVREITLQI